MTSPANQEPSGLSKSQIRKAGDQLRRQLRHTDIVALLADPANAEAWQTVDEFRREHVLPTLEITLHVSAMGTKLGSGKVVPRIKRSERIVEKIARNSTALDRLQDIGGCRIVVPDVEAQHAVVTGLLALPYELVDVDDYVSPPKESPFENDSRGPKGSGYRAIHVVHRVHGKLMETQVRTEIQHHWAAAAERAEQNTGFALKFGDAPGVLLDYFKTAASIQALQEFDESVDDELLRQLAELREQIRWYYRGQG